MDNNRIFYQDNYDDDPNNEIGLDSINSQKEGTYSSSANGVFTGSLLESFFTNNDVSGVPSPAFVIGEKPGDIIEGKGVVPVEPGPGPGPDLPPNNEIWYTSSTGEAIDFAGGGGSGSGSGNGDGENAPYESNEYVDGKGILRFSEEVTEVPYFFSKCKTLTSVTLPNSVTNIKPDAFYCCSSLATITIPEGVTAICEYAFAECTSLKTVTIPKYVTFIGYSAFNECRDLVSITCLPVESPRIYESTFSDTNNCPIYVPAESVDSYRSSYGWSEYVNRIQPIE